MFDRLKSVFSSTVSPDPVSSGVLSAWARERRLRPVNSVSGSTQWEGQWLGGSLAVRYGPSTRPYISGYELSLKADLGLRKNVRVVVMNRSLKLALQAMSDRLYSHVTDALRTNDKPFPEEVGWLTQYRDAGWSGPPEDFWSNFAVLSSAPESARCWLDAAMVSELISVAQSWPPQAPIWWGILRAKLHMRAQWTPDRQDGMSPQALVCFERLAHRSKTLFPR